MLTKIKEFFTRVFTPKKELYEKIDNLTSEKTILTETVVDRENKVSELEKNLEEVNEKISEMREIILNKDRQIWDYELEIHRLQSIIEDLTDSGSDTESY